MPYKNIVASKKKQLTCLFFQKNLHKGMIFYFFDALLDYVIIGGYDENGVKDQYLVRFILNRKFSSSVQKEIPEELIIKNNKTDLESRKVLVDFIDTRKYFSLERNENGKLCKVLQNGLRIRIECDIT